MRRRFFPALAAAAFAAAGLAGAAPVSGLAVTLVPTPDVYAVIHDHKLVVPDPGVLGNDIGLGGGSRAVLDSGPSHGSLDLQNGGGFTYQPDGGYVGTDGFAYHPSDSLLLGTTVTITVTNTAPVAVADAYVATAGTQFRVDPPGVLANDTDADGDGLTAALVSDVSHGSLELRSTGEVRYTPDPGFAGVDTFRYRAGDGVAWSLPATVTITVVAPTPKPTPRPSATPRPTPSPIVLPTLIPTPSLSPAPTLIPTPTPSATTGPTPAPTPSPTAGSSAGTGASGGSTPGPTASPTNAPVALGGTTGGGSGSGSGGDGPYVLGPPAVDPVQVVSIGSSGLGDYDWAVPAAVLSVPGFLLIVFVLGQAAAGLVWVPLARRRLRGLGTGSEPRAR
jgi:hypothetical protein